MSKLRSTIRSRFRLLSLCWLSSWALLGSSEATAEELDDKEAPENGTRCVESLTEADLRDPLTTITLVHLFKAGDFLRLSLDDSNDPFTAPFDLCLVKLNIGPGNPGVDDAPSTSPGIGVEIWLPASDVWNHRYVAYGTGGYAGAPDVSSIHRISAQIQMAFPIVAKGFATSYTDGGHSSGLDDFSASANGSFALNPDGTVNWRSLKDFAYRAQHLTSERTKALIHAYYGRSSEYSYFNGTSSGGREGLMLAQRYPQDFDGIVSAMPAINWPRFVPAIMWGKIVMQQDLGGPIAEEKVMAVTDAAIASCDTQLTGEHDGFISDPGKCQYDPSRDQAMLCLSDGGASDRETCLSLAEARAINKIWYGPTTGAGVIDPAIDNGWHGELTRGQLWFGYPRGAILHDSPVTFGYGPAGHAPFPISSDWLALVLEAPAYTTEAFQNASGTGRERWKEIGYRSGLTFTDVMLASIEKFSALIATDQPDLSEFKAAGGKLIHWHGIDDNIIPAAGSVHYYERVIEMMGGVEQTRDFYRFYLGPGIGHGVAGVEGVAAPVPGGDVDGELSASTNNSVLPLLQDWVERGRAPGAIIAVSDETENPALTRPWCAYPEKIRYVGGPIEALSGYVCKQDGGRIR